MPGMISFMTLDPDVLSPEAPGCHQVACAPHGWVGVGEREEKGISQEAVSSVSGVQGGGSVEYVSRPLSALPIATLYKGSASIHCSLGMLLGP